MTSSVHAALRGLPPAHALLATETARALLERLPRALVRELAREALARLRAEHASAANAASDRAALLARAEALLGEGASAHAALRPRVRRVLNATGVVLHTNLGRAPLGAAVLDAVREASEGYAAVEYDLDEGARGHRDRALAALCRPLLGCEDALAVNNCAAAVLLVATALGAGREVLVSRGELVEIGGGFRVPEVLTSCGARVVEVGTTNKTRVEDYARALGPETAFVLKVHRSNFTVRGFTAEASLAELSALARGRGVPLVYDAGSGWLLERGEAPAWLPDEPTPRAALRDGADLVLFSGDKLLGGPQAGLLVGRADLVARLRRHPLVRALRPGRLVLAALEATLRAHLTRAPRERWLPALERLVEPLAAVRARGEALCEALEREAPAARGALVPSEGAVGGGSMPEASLPSCAVVLRGVVPAKTPALLRALRRVPTVPLVARVLEGHVALDLRALGPDEVAAAARAVAQALAGLHETTRATVEAAVTAPSEGFDEEEQGA